MLTILDQNTSTYDAIGEDYTEVLSRPYYDNELRKGFELLERSVRQLTTTGVARVIRALDIGCGVGQYTRFLLEQGLEVVAVDSSRSMLAATLAAAGDHNARLSCGHLDAASLEKIDGPFELVVALGSVVNHLSDWDHFLQQCARLLAPRGHLVLSMDHLSILEGAAWALYTTILRKPDRPGALSTRTQDGPRVSPSTFVEWPLYLNHQRYSVFLQYRSLKHVTKVLRECGLRGDYIGGVNLISAMLPRVTLSSVYDVGPTNGLFSRLVLALSRRIDDRLGSLLPTLAATQYVVATRAAADDST